jgi:hypothetical protein
MNLDDNQKTSQSKPITKSLESIAALRAVMEMKLAHAHRDKSEYESPAEQPPPPKTGADTKEKPRTKAKAATPDDKKAPDAGDWPRIMMRIAERSQKLVGKFLARDGALPVMPGAPDPAHLGAAFLGRKYRCGKVM